MQKRVCILLAVAFVLLALSAVTFAGAKDGRAYFQFDDVAVIACLPNGCIVIEGSINIYGIGADRFWETKPVDRPEVGDIISVSGYVSKDGLYIATTITIDNITIDLRDYNGRPKWR